MNAALSQEHLREAAHALCQAAQDVCSPPEPPSPASALQRESSMSPKEGIYAGLVRKSMQQAA